MKDNILKNLENDIPIPGNLNIKRKGHTNVINLNDVGYLGIFIIQIRKKVNFDCWNLNIYVY